ncbi:DUF2242 domain-containing protein [Stenotrophomonas sp. Betaine-02u-21]|uniref:DUF2242 domain-containing protein n=1 Tax=unclassified Stenotrophomonas TaxID=196198 RepID=UPI000C326DED|nr:MULTISPECIES: DUF2242 domain-containing protein [unclassified Stenotrophomonas]PKH71241.1 DUF2242 domain-containing protein [Stenotrophomonas sp. Betaine-02u-21]PKH72401.1 DUF2242 domain-containing protein [Stenotrophomonas sp. Betaine-02u-23]PKH96930.1 DUF2242 domain-containing protein [Stenotrophomonas sp. Bg11-02]
MRTAVFLTPVVLMAGLSGCGGRAADSTLLRESFDSGDMYSRTVDGSPAEACEAARRTLLSQGYAIARADGTGVEGSKNFQPRDDDHEQLVLRISCAPRGQQALVFISAVQDRYALKKSPTSASVGVGALGSVSLPFGSNDDSLVKVASSTVQDGEFYGRFFQRLQQYLPVVAAPAPAPAAAPAADPPPTDSTDDGLR